MNRYIERINNGETPEAVLKDVFRVATETIEDCLRNNTNCPLLDEMQAVLEIIEITEDPQTAPVVFIDGDAQPAQVESDDWDDGDLS